MKRPFLVALIIGILVSAAFGLLHAFGLLANVEMPVREFVLRRSGSVTGALGEQWQHLLMSILAIGIAWMTLAASRRGRLVWLVVALLIELAGFTWVCSLYHVFFQPLPSMFAVVVSFIVSERFFAIYAHSRSRTARVLLGDRLSKKQIQRVVAGEIPFDPEPRTFETTVVVCDIANKYELAEENDPAVFAETTEAFIRRATDHFLEADAYVQAADGEGVVALFGFPGGQQDHADKAVRMTLGLIEAFRDFRLVNNGEAPTKCDVHVGVSSGTMIAAPLKDSNRPGLLTSGEPVELARRFCVANRFYGSRILIGPRTFELASKHVVARPIDFLSGVNSQERHEIFEPLCLATEAKPEGIARRDSFWNGVVLYREKRWAEAYSEFQKARGPDGEEEDAPLQLYLRRLEVLALHLADAPEAK
jgi:adenylate cyclase